MSRIRSATIVIILTPSSGSIEKSTKEEYWDFEEIYIVPETDGFEDLRENKDTHKAFLDELSKRALEAAGHSDKVVIRCVTTSSQDCQETLVKRLIQGGASNENITVVRLAMDHTSNKTRRSGSFYRTNYCTWRPNKPWTILATKPIEADPSTVQTIERGAPTIKFLIST